MHTEKLFSQQLSEDLCDHSAAKYKLLKGTFFNCSNVPLLDPHLYWLSLTLRLIILKDFFKAKIHCTPFIRRFNHNISQTVTKWN